MTPELQKKIVGCTVGSKLGCILRCALGIELDAIPRFIGKASVTSDGYLMCSFIDHEGLLHPGAFVGSMSDLDLNLAGLRKHLSLNSDEFNELTALVASWIGTDYRPSTRVMRAQQEARV